MPSHFIKVTILIFFVLVLFNFNNESYAVPNFSNQQIKDDVNDQITKQIMGTEPCALALSTTHLMTDIIGTSFVSNGEQLNATIWFKEPLQSNISALLGEKVMVFPIIENAVPVSTLDGDLFNSSKYSPLSYAKSKDLLTEAYVYESKGVDKEGLYKIVIKTIDNGKVQAMAYYSSNIYLLKEFVNEYITSIYDNSKTLPVKKYTLNMEFDHNSKLIGYNDTIEDAELRHSIYIDVVSVYDNPLDYKISLIRNTLNNQWVEQTEEVFIHSSNPKFNLLKNLTNSESLTPMNHEGYTDSHTFNIDLKSIGSPDEYLVYFSTFGHVSTKDSNTKCSSYDVTGTVSIPIPTINVTFDPYSFTLQPYQKKEITVLAESEANLNTQVYFDDQNNSNYTLNFIPNTLLLPAKGKSSLILEIESLKNIPLDELINIPATVNFPNSYTQVGSNSSIAEEGFSNISFSSYPHIKIEKPKEFLVYVGEAFTSANSGIQTLAGTITAVVGIITGVGALIATLFKRYKNKPKMESDYKKNGSPF